MTITITFGWWLAPLAVTIAACGLAWWIEHRDDHYTGLVGGAVTALFLWMPAIIASLIAWLIWAVLT